VNSHRVWLITGTSSGFGRAIAEARRSFDAGPWASMPPAERTRILHALVDHIEANVDLIKLAAGSDDRFFRASISLSISTSSGTKLLLFKIE